MDSLKQSIVHSLDGYDLKLFPHLAYLLQDSTELGASSNVVIQLLKNNKILNPNSRVLDLGCGKGAISIKIAKECGCPVTGIDAYEPFLAEAQKQAKQKGVAQLCTFEKENILEGICKYSAYELLILSAVRPPFEKLSDMLEYTGNSLIESGYVILDDCYTKSEVNYIPNVRMKKEETLHNIEKAGFRIVDEYIFNSTEIIESNKQIFRNIQKRAIELIDKYPEKKLLFEAYIHNQHIENEVLENELICVCWLLKKIR